MDHSLIRLPLSENFSAQYTRLTHFTHTPAQTQHRNHSLPHSLIYTEFLPYNYNVDASPRAHPRTQRGTHGGSLQSHPLSGLRPGRGGLRPIRGHVLDPISAAESAADLAIIVSGTGEEGGRGLGGGRTQEVVGQV